jgi:hypothetical protein
MARTRDQLDSICLPGMPRRAFLAITAAGLLAAPLAAEGQQAPGTTKIGLLSVTTPAVLAPALEAFKHALRELGHVESKGRRSSWRFATARADSSAFRSSHASW